MTQGCAFWGSERWPTTFRGSNFPKTVKIGVNMHCKASQPRVNEE